MLLGAIVDAGVPIDFLRETTSNIAIDGYTINQSKVWRCGIQATKVDVEIHKSTQTHTHWKDIFKLLDSSTLPDKIKIKALNIFRAIFNAEAKVHGGSFQDVHLHELGGIDCIVDIVGAVSGFDYLGIEEIYVSDINLGSGMVNISHGFLPVPAPATIELLKGYKCYKSQIPYELTTPTGAAIISTITKQTDTLSYIPISLGYGAGTRDIKEQPNVLRLIVANSQQIKTDESLYVVETNIDDMNPQYFEHIMDILLEIGANDVYLENIIMKKSRPATKITVLTDQHRLQSVCDALFRHTTTIGLRFYEVFRQKLNREITTLNTDFGVIRIKTATDSNNITKYSIEYSDLLKASKTHSLPLSIIEKHVRDLLTKMRDRG